jgi:hypothetical protein
MKLIPSGRENIQAVPRAYIGMLSNHGRGNQGVDISAMLYSTIAEIGKEKIQSEIALDIKQSKYYIELIINNCKKRIDNVDEDTVGSLCEALLHFMLTISILPSIRKVAFNGTVLDIVIPSLRVLKNSPENSVVILISKGSENIIQEKISHIKRFQPNEKNLWIVSEKPLPLPCVNYSLIQNEIFSEEKNNYSDLIIDIDKFLHEKGDKSLKIFQ